MKVPPPPTRGCHPVNKIAKYGHFANILQPAWQAIQGQPGELLKIIKQHKEMKQLRTPIPLGTFLDVFRIIGGHGIDRENISQTSKGKERRTDMKKGQGNGGALTWSGIREISKEANKLCHPLPDSGLCTKTHLAHVDSGPSVSQVRGSRIPIPETGHPSSQGRNLFPSFEK
jgi:hypothetical protein